MAAREIGLGLGLRLCQVRNLGSKCQPVLACARIGVRSLSTRSVRPPHSPLVGQSFRVPFTHGTRKERDSLILTLLRFNSSSATSKSESTQTPKSSPSTTEQSISSTPPSPSSSIATPPPTNEPTLSTQVAKTESKDAKPDVSTILQLLAFAKPQWKLITVGVICLVISTGVNLGIPWVIGQIIDFFAPGSEKTLLFGLPVEQATFALAVVLLLGAAANSGRSIALRLSGQRTAAAIRNKTYSKYMSMPPSHIETSGVGDALSRIGQDTSIVGQSLSENLGEGLKAVLGAGAGIVAMWLISPTLTLVMLFVIPPISIGSFFYGRFIRKLSLKTQEAMGAMSKLAEERLSAHRTVTASNTQPSEQALFAGKVDGVYQLQKKETYANGLFQGANEAAGDLGIIGLLLYGGVLMQRGEISVGDMTALFIYVNWIEWSLNSELASISSPRHCGSLTFSPRKLFHRSHERCGSFSTYHQSPRTCLSRPIIHRRACSTGWSRFDRT